MSVKKEPSGRRSVQVEIEVPGTPEQVWQAIASGPGISSWFVPTQLDGRVGGALALDFGGGMVTSATITEWQPPRRFVAEDRSWLQGGPPVATEWIVEARSGGTCTVRVVHSLFASTDEWDGQLEGTEHGWPGYFRVLRHYLQHHAGEPSASFVLMAPCADAAAPTWAKFAQALGVAAPRTGQPLRVAGPGGALLAGAVQAVDKLPWRGHHGDRAAARPRHRARERHGLHGHAHGDAAGVLLRPARGGGGGAEGTLAAVAAAVVPAGRRAGRDAVT